MMNEWIISSSLLIGAVLLGRRLLRGRISLRLQYALWLAVLIRLLLPVQIFTSSIGAGSMARTVDISEPVRQVYASAREDDYERVYDAAYSQVVAEYLSTSQTYDPVVVEKVAAAQAKQTMELDLKKLLYGAWFAGMVVMTSVIASCNIHLGLHLKRRRWEYPVPDSLLSVYITEAVPTPCIFGLFHPAIYLTPEAAGEGSVRNHVLAHELTHYRHWDHIWSVLRSLCLILHWYNPLVWIAAKVSRADAELACDEGALAKLGEEHRADYGRTLIGLTCPDHGGSVFVTATTMTGSAGSIRERIKLLMKRPRNTVLALIAVVLIGTIIVGCAFAGAPETTEHGINLEDYADFITNGDENVRVEMDFAEKPTETEPEFGTVAYFDDLLNPDLYRSEADWYPRALTSYYDSPAGIDLFQLFYGGIPGADNAPTASEEYFLQRKPGYEPDFDLVRIPREEMDRVLTEYFGTTLAETAQIGLTNFMYYGMTDCYFHSHTDTNLSFRTVTAAEELTNGSWRVLYTSDIGDGEVILRQRDGKWQIISHLSLDTTSPDSMNWTEQIRYSLSENGDPANLEALTRLWCGWTGFSENESVAPFVPEILDCVQVSNDTVMVYYRRPGGAQLYAAEMMPHEDGWAATTNSLVISRPEGARDLTQEEIERVSAAFRPDIYDEERGEGYANPLACLVNDYYDDITKLDRSELLAYFPGSTGATEREFKLLKEKYPDFFEGWTWEDMPIPIHCYDPKTMNAVLGRYADIRWEDLAWDDDLHYLEETGCFYNYTSDFGLFGFHCTGGWVYDGGAVILSARSALWLTERNGDYFISAHLPAMTMPTHSSNPMIPAEVPAPITADYAGENFRADRSYHCDETEYVSSIGFTINERLTDVRFGSLEWAENGWQMEKVLYTTTELKANWGFLAEVVFWGDTTTYGISFTDAGGAKRHFSVSISGEDGSLVLTEYTQGYPAGNTNAEEEIGKTVEAFLAAYGENVYLYTDNEYDHLTVLAADEDATAFYSSGQSVPMLDFRNNIQNVHKMEDYWKQARQEQGITRHNFEGECHFDSITFDGDTATVTVGYAMSFTYDDQPGTTSGLRDDYRLQLVRVDGTWLIADVTEIGA